ncbi:MAG TPA: hypothetical protein DCQ06_07275 [Myxococcales bacterium]|nr:hypothetical protein [Myxococcales bacterium]HAN31382.1 hypothetical protein [Myxococcales bacterium]
MLFNTTMIGGLPSPLASVSDLSPQMNSAQQQQVSFVSWGMSWQSSVGIVLICLATIVVWLAWRNLRGRLSGHRLWALICWRLVSVSLLVLIAMRPSWVTEQRSVVSRSTAVLIDVSSSMRHHGRLKRAIDQVHRLRRDGPLHLFTFGERLEPMPSNIAATVANATHSDIQEALTSLAGSMRPPGLGQILIISDGIVPALVDGIPPEIQSILAELKVPIHTIALEDPSGLMDVEVADIRASPFAFARSALPVEVDLNINSGPKWNKLSATLVMSLDGQPVSQKLIALKGPSKRTVELEIQPKTLGPHVLSAAVVPLAEEVTAANNRLHRPLQVLRDRVRVMHLAGHPSWDSRFLRSHLRSSPDIDLVSFYIMVGPGGLMAQSQDTALIPFPTQQLFGPALDDFDLVIFQNFDFRPFGIDMHLPTLEKWVRDGGAFWVVGGPNTLASRQWSTSALNRWLPVKMTAADRPGWTDQRIKAQRTTLGAQHLVTRVGENPRQDERLWRALDIEGYNTNLTSRAHASVLIQSSSSQPLLTVADHGSGRVAVWATDSLWSWAFPQEHTEHSAGSQAAYHRFVQRLRGWLLRAPEYQPLRIQTSNQIAAKGEPVVVEVDLRGPDLRARPNVSVSLSATSLPEGAQSSELHRGKTNAQGRASLQWRPQKGGAWRLTVQTHDGATGRAAIGVDEHIEEERMVHADVLGLKALSRATAGQALDSTRSTLPALSAMRPQIQLKSRESSPLWQHWAIVLLFISALIGEWIVRRRWGLT